MGGAPLADPEAGIVTGSARALRINELVLVLAVAFAPLSLSAMHAYLHGSFAVGPEAIERYLLYLSMHEVLALALLAYVLSRRGQGLRQLGLCFAWRDVTVTLGLLITSRLLSWVCLVVSNASYRYVTGQELGFSRPWNPVLAAGLGGLLVFCMLNAVFEELIVRAYAITEIIALTNSTTTAIAVSVGVQTLYHLYLGVPYALAVGATFWIFSVYYVTSGRIAPIIAAHFLSDLPAIFYARGWV